MESSNQCDLNDYARNVIRHKARQLIGKYGFTRDDYEDLMQELALDLLVRLAKFDPSRASLDTFVNRIIDRKVANLIRFQRQEKRDRRREAFSLDAPVGDGEGGTIRGVNTISQEEHDFRTGRHSSTAAEREDMHVEVSSVISALPPELQALAKLLMTHSITEAARELGVHRDTLHSARLPQLREIFEDKGLREYL